MKVFMGRMGRCCIILLCAGLFFGHLLAPVPVQAITLTNANDIASNATLSDTGGATNDTYVFNSGSFDILSTLATTIDISAAPTKHIALNAGSSLVVGALGTHANTLLQVDTLFLQAGTVTATGGGTGGNNYGIGVGNDFNMSGTGTVTATGGGAGLLNFGIEVYRDFNHSGAGTVTATGGAGGNNYGIEVNNDFNHSGAGAVTATGGGGAGNNNYGIYVGNDFNMSGAGTVTATGGSGTGGNNYGIYVIRDFNHSGAGTVTATGGAGNNNYGIGVANDFNMSGAGAVTATGGGAGSNNYGIWVIRDFILSNNGTVTATGGAGSNNVGIGVNRDFNHSGTGTVTATGGGAGNSNHGIWVSRDFILSNNGAVTATGGGAGSFNYGIYVNRDFTLSGAGTVTATGGAGNNNHGIWVANDFNHSGAGTVTATGGSGAGSNNYGIRVNNDFNHSGAGTVTATGGGGAGSSNDGIYVARNFILSNNGAVTATGGAGNNNYGIGVANDFNMSGTGTVTATGGGAGNNNYGIYVGNDFNMSGAGTVTATGGAGIDSYGIYVNRDFNMSGAGVVTAASGAGPNSIGMYVDEKASIAGTLQLMPGAGNSASLFVHNVAAAPVALEFAPTSQVSLGFGGSNIYPVTGFIQVDQGDILINPGATVQLGTIANASNMAVNHTYTYLFMESAGTITNEFLLQNANTPTFTFALNKQGNQYFAAVTRTQYMADVIAGNLLGNEQALMYGLTNIFGVNTPESATLRAYSDALESAATIEDATAMGITLQRNMAPHAFSRVPQMAVRNSRMARNAMHNAFTFSGNTNATHLNTANFDNATASESFFYNKNSYLVANNSAENTVSDIYPGLFERPQALDWQVWTEAYGQIASLDAKNRQFSNADERTAGASLGMRRMFVTGHSVALAGHYLHNTLRTNNSSRNNGKTDITNNSYGISLGGRFALPCLNIDDSGSDAALEIIASYSALDIEQERYIFGQRADSETTGHLYQLGATLYVPVQPVENIELTPEFGVTYSFVNVDKFSENNSSQLGLRISPDDYSSLLVHAGIRMDTRLDSSINAYIGTTVSYDVLDEQVKLDNAFRSASQVRFKTTSEDNNSINANLQTGLNIDLWQDAALQADYTFGVAKDYTSHAVGLSLSIGF